MRTTATAALLLLALAGCTAQVEAAPIVPVGHAEFEFVGEWAGEPDGDGVLGMTVTSAADDGTSFDGDLTFRATDLESTGELHAAMTPHGHLVAEIGEDASIELHITDASTLDYCFIRYGTDPVQACGRLVRGD